VLDVGSGTGILSIFAAQAGAAKVFAVEASNLAKLSREIIQENHFEDIIDVHNCKIEEFQLPAGVGKVDIIISEWMGFYLLHEGMLDSVLLARDRFLKPGGALFPDKAIIYVCPCKLPAQFDDWEDVAGVKMTKFAEHLRHQQSKKPGIITLNNEDLLASDTIVAFIDLNDVSPDELDRFDFKEVIVARKSGEFQGICLWFDVIFPANEDDPTSENVVLSTHPQAQPTHWKQTIIPLPANIETLEPLMPVAFKLIIQRNPENARHYHLLLEILDAAAEDHALPCDCILTKCILTKAHLASVADQFDVA